MTMDRMIEYLENRGFKAEKKYIAEKRFYEFRISKEGKPTVTSIFEYPGQCDEATKDMRQRNFLDGIMKSYNENFDIKPIHAIDTDAVYLSTSNARDWVQKHFVDYVKHDIEISKDTYKSIVNSEPTTYLIKNFSGIDMKIYGVYNDSRKVPAIKNVIFNDPATIIFWSDGTKTVVKCGQCDVYDPEKGMAMAIAKKALGNQGNYFNEIKKWCEPEWEKEDENAKTVVNDFFKSIFRKTIGKPEDVVLAGE